MIRLYLIRHGETDWNKEKRFQGWTDIELNEEGNNQAKLLGKRFENIKIDELYSSPLKRSYKTAEPVSEVTGLPIVLKEAFKEINFGTWEGLTAHEIKEQHGEEFVGFMNNPEECEFPGDGSFQNVTNRIEEGLKEILKDKDNKNIAIVSHGGIVRIMVKHLMKFEGQWFNKTWIDNTSITVIEMTEKGNLLRVLNDFSHIRQV